MRINRQLLVLPAAVFLFLAFCGLALSQDGQAVDPSELSFSLKGFKGKTETNESGERVLNGAFKAFLCEGKEIEVVSRNVEDGNIETREYGTIKVSTNTSGGLEVFLMPEQHERLLEDFGH